MVRIDGRNMRRKVGYTAVVLAVLTGCADSSGVERELVGLAQTGDPFALTSLLSKTWDEVTVVCPYVILDTLPEPLKEPLSRYNLENEARHMLAFRSPEAVLPVSVDRHVADFCGITSEHDGSYLPEQRWIANQNEEGTWIIEPVSLDE